MNSSTIRWGIIGCGDVTEVKSGPAFNKVPHSKLVAVMRRNAGKARDYAERHGVDKWYSDAEALINDPDVNAVYVATPPDSHEQYAVQALRAGKPVYLEKPMALNAEAAERIAREARELGMKLSVAHYRRQQPLFLKIRSLLQEKAIGEPRLANLQLFLPHRNSMIPQTEVNWRLDPAISGGGLFYDLAPHQLDLMLYFLGRPCKANGLSYNASGLYGADDTTSGQVIFENGVMLSGAWCFTLPEKRDVCEIIGTEGSLRFSIFDQQPVVLVRDGQETRFEFERLPHVQQPMIENVVQYFRGEAENPCSAEEGVEVMEMIKAFSGSR